MPFSALLTLTFGLTSVLAAPAASQAPRDVPFSYLPVTLNLHSGADTFDFIVQADGQVHNTGMSPSLFPTVSLAVMLTNIIAGIHNLIDSITSPNYDPYYACNFNFSGAITLSNNADGSIGISPPSALNAVACEPTSAPPAMCLPVQGMFSFLVSNKHSLLITLQQDADGTPIKEELRA